YHKVLGIKEPTDDIGELIEQLSKKIGALRQGGEVDADKTLHYFLRSYRNGGFGRLCLDDLDEESVDAFFKNSVLNRPLSKNQDKKAKRAAQRQRSLEKARSKNLL
ncbi:Mitochondrial GTPase 1, partial [Coemansia sp. RSA 2703]